LLCCENNKNYIFIAKEKTTPNAAKTKVMNILKESKAKFTSKNSNKKEENGKITNYKNNGHDSDASLNDSLTKLSLNDSFNIEQDHSSYPMTVFNRKLSKNITNDDREDNGFIKTIRKDSSDGNSSDRSVSSSKSLLDKNKSFDSDKITHLSKTDIS